MPTLAERRALARAARLPAWPSADLSLPLRRCRVAVLDTETTGTDPSTARIVEVAVVILAELGASEPEVVYRQRVRPGVPIPSGAVDVHGITDDAVSAAPTWPELWPDLVKAVGPGPVIPCAFNAPYDYQVLAAEAQRHGLPPMAWGWLDPLVLVKAVDQYEKGRKLREAAQRRGIQHAEHGAAADAVVAALLLAQLLKEAALGVQSYGKTRLRMPGGMTLAGYLRWQADLALVQEVDWAEFCRKEGRRTPPDWTWHRLEGLDPPPSFASPKPQTAKCSSCGADILWLVNDKGTRCPVDPDQYEVVTFHALTAAGLDAAAFSQFPVERGFVGTDSAVGVALPSEVRPDLPRSLLRRSHFASCAHADAHRRSA